MGTHLKLLLQQRHLQAHGAFCREYDRVAKTIDADLIGSWPSRATLHRWMTGDLKGLPYPDHCRILEGMFPGWTTDRLLQPSDQGEAPGPSDAGMAELVHAVRQGLAGPTPAVATWPTAPRTTRDQGGTTLTLPPPLSARMASENGDAAPELGRSLVALQKKLRLTDEDTRQLAQLAGQVVDLSLTVAITVEPNGDALVTYTHELVNLTPAPLRRIPRQIWFEHMSTATLKIAAILIDGRRFMVQRTHDAGHISKFACQFSPPIEPGGHVRFGFSCVGGRFVEDYYWHQDFPRPTRHTTISVRHRQATLLNCGAIEQLQDGSEVFATDEILWDHEGSDVTITLTRDYLGPGQALTLRWETDGDSAPA